MKYKSVMASRVERLWVSLKSGGIEGCGKGDRPLTVLQQKGSRQVLMEVGHL